MHVSLRPPSGSAAGPTRAPLAAPAPQAAEHMRDTFEQHGAAWFAPCHELHSGPTFQAASPPRPRAGQQGQAGQQAAAAAEAAAEQGAEGQQGEEVQQQEQEEPQWQSQWAAAGWLQDNPLVRRPAGVLFRAAPATAHCCRCGLPFCSPGATPSARPLPAWAVSAQQCCICTPPTPPTHTYTHTHLAVQGVPTEREVLTTAQGLPVYRVMLRRL